ncbi:hypothetical protein F5Y10DRAFT_229701 [Nemania abortiva]|nr:hypothetical protein F5Y10DRAFT_229701 [Nemania abortiva]
MFSKALLAATVIGAATAQVPAIAKREFIENRQDGLDLDPACESALSAVTTLYASVPTPPADLLSQSLPTDPCVTPSFTGKLESEWVSYTSAAFQWYSSHSDELNSFITACSGLVDESAATDIPVCSTAVTGVTSAAATTTSESQTTKSSGGSSSGSAPTSTGAAATSSAASSSSSAAGSGSAASSTVSTGAAPRETGFVVAAAMAAAGFMGAVAAL